MASSGLPWCSINKGSSGSAAPGPPAIYNNTLRHSASPKSIDKVSKKIAQKMERIESSATDESTPPPAVLNGKDNGDERYY
jgi:hypothetical protein